MSYDAEERLLTWQNAQSSPTSSASYAYDGEGHRVEQQVTTSGTTTTTYYIGSYEEVSVTGSTTTTSKYYPAGLTTAVSVTGTISYLIQDEQGSVDEALSSSGSVTADQIFFPYGTVRYSTGSMPTSYGYTGQRADPSGLMYYGARYYDPTVGQFTSVDTVQGPNRYAYVGGNPTTMTDPSGQFAGSGQLFLDEGTNSCGIFVNTGSGCSFGTPVGSSPITLNSSGTAAAGAGTIALGTGEDSLVVLAPEIGIPLLLFVGGAALTAGNASGTQATSGAAAGSVALTPSADTSSGFSHPMVDSLPEILAAAQAAGAFLASIIASHHPPSTTVTAPPPTIPTTYSTPATPPAIPPAAGFPATPITIPPLAGYPATPSFLLPYWLAATVKPSAWPPSWNDPTQSPGPNWQWRPASGTPGDPFGAWYNPDTGETWHPNLDHGYPPGPHWDWGVRGGDFWQWFEDGRFLPRGH